MRQLASRPPAPRARWGAAFGLTLGLLLGVLAFAPARWLAQALPASGRMALSDARGTIWHGSARLWLTGGPGSTDRQVLPGRVHWRIGADASGLGLRLQADCCTPQPLQLRLPWPLGPGGLRLELADGLSVWPAHWLSGLGTPWNTLALSGQLQLQTQGLALRLGAAGLSPAGGATLELQDLSSALSTLKPLGSYRLHLALGPQADLELHTLQGELQLSGQGQLSATGLRFRGRAEAAAGRELALGNLLNIIGRRDGARSASLWVDT